MKPTTSEKIIKTLNLRTHKLSVDVIIQYILGFFSPQIFLLLQKNPWPFIVITFASFVYPRILIIAPFFLFFVINDSIANECEANIYKEYDDAVMAISLRHNHSLEELLKHRPQLVDLERKKKTLTYWCKYYKNAEAHNLIVSFKKNNTK